MVEEEEETEEEEEEEEAAKRRDPRESFFSFLNLPSRAPRKISSCESLPLDGFFDWAHICLPWAAHYAL